MRYERWIIGISDWPESPDERFDIFRGRQGETDLELIARARASYGDKISLDIVYKPVDDDIITP